MNVKCPQCKQPVEWSDANTYKPFCSKRCTMIDLGDWFEERHAIPETREPGLSNEDFETPGS